jgi:hypothetical protein
VGTTGALTLASAGCCNGEQRKTSDTEGHDNEIDGLVACTHINCNKMVENRSKKGLRQIMFRGIEFDWAKQAIAMID